MKGVNIREVQEYLGHANVETTQQASLRCPGKIGDQRIGLEPLLADLRDRFFEAFQSLGLVLLIGNALFIDELLILYD